VSQATAAKSKACFKCGSLSHFKADCPLLKRGNAPLGSAGTRGEGNQTRRVFNCTTEGAPIAASGNNMGNASKGTSEVDSRGQVPSNPSTGGRSNAAAASQLTSCKSVVNDVTITPSMGVEACEIARLNYINVGIASHDNSGNYLSVSALEDSGSQIAVANKNLIDQLDDVNVIGSVKIRGVIGDAVNCELVRLQVCLLSNVEQSTAECNARSIAVTCAVSEAANDQLLLPVDIIERLHNQSIIELSESHDDSDDSSDDDLHSDDETAVNDNIHADVISAGTDRIVNVVTRTGTDTNRMSAGTNSNNTTASVDRPILCPPVDVVDVDKPVNADVASDIPVDGEMSKTTQAGLIKEQQYDM